MLAVVFALVSLACAAAVWALVVLELGKRWIADHSASALRKRQGEFEEGVEKRLHLTDERLEVNKRAISNLAKEIDEAISSMRAQQAGAMAMGQTPPRRSQFSR
jgi:hypothetical protein